MSRDFLVISLAEDFKIAMVDFLELNINHVEKRYLEKIKFYFSTTESLCWRPHEGLEKISFQEENAK